MQPARVFSSEETMPRRPRCDEPGAWHHVTNRGIAKRTLFEGASDIRCFLALLARAVRGGMLEVHAFCVLMTHFHLLVRSPRGELSQAMQVIQNQYVRRFNRRRRRDGTLVRGRFWSKRVLSLRYRSLLVQYIDRNPVKAGMAESAARYPFGSAKQYAAQSGPRWLTRAWVEAAVREATGAQTYDPREYAKAFPPARGTSLDALVASRLSYAGEEDDPLDDLFGAAPAAVRSWMRYKARLADETKPGMPVVDASSVLQAVARAATDPWAVRWGRKQRCAWTVARAVLLRDLAGATYAEIARLCGRSPHYWRTTYGQHGDHINSDSEYRNRVLELTRAVLTNWSPNTNR